MSVTLAEAGSYKKKQVLYLLKGNVRQLLFQALKYLAIPSIPFFSISSD